MLHLVPWLALALGLVATVGARGQSGLEVGASSSVEAAARAKRKRDKLARVGRVKLQAENQRRRESRLARRSQVNCCDASTDDWRDDKPLYKAWLPDGAMSWDEAYQACFAESVAAAERGDYSKPASRRCVLGKMHESKRAAWDQCRAGCAGSALSGFETYAGEGGVQWWTPDEGATVAGVQSSSDGWRVLYQGRGDRNARLVDVFDTRGDAEDKALSLLGDDLPF
jgi:hypothetical protein